MNKHTQTPTSGSARRLALFILITLILAAAAMLWNWAGKQGYITAVEHSLTKYLADADIFSSRSRNMLNELEAKQAEIGQRLNHLEGSLQAAGSLPVIAGKLPANESSGTRSGIWVLGMVEQLIVLSDRQLRLTGDVHSALDSLKQAHELLQSSTVLGSSKLNAMLAGEIGQLEAQPAVDISGIVQDIEKLAAQIDTLPLATEAHMASIDLFGQHDDASEPGWWSRYLHEIGADLGRLIKIEKTTDPGLFLLSPSQTRLLKENIRLQLMLARLAVLTRNESDFDAAMKSAAGWIQCYFNTETQLVRDVLGELERLAGTNIGSRLLDIGSLLEVVHHDQFIMKGEVE